MANYSNLKAAIADAIKTNGTKAITGQVLQDVLNSMVSVIGANYTFAGVATPSTNPSTPDQNVFYLAIEGGTYTNFNNTEIPDGISVLIWNGSWKGQVLFRMEDVVGTSVVLDFLGNYYIVNGVLTSLNSQRAYYKKVKKGDVYNVKVEETGSSIYYGVYPQIPVAGDTTQENGHFYTEGQIQAQNDGYLVVCYYYTLTFTISNVISIKGLYEEIQKLQEETEDISDSDKKKVDINIKGTLNYFDKNSDEIEYNKNISPSSGNIADATGVAVSPFIKLEPNLPYHISIEGDEPVGNSNYGLNIYNENKERILSGNVVTLSTFEVSSVRYVRFSFRMSDIDTVVMEAGKYRSRYTEYNKVAGYLQEEIPDKYYSEKKTESSLSTSLKFDNFVDACKLGNNFSLYADIPNGIGDGIIIGWGPDIISGTYIILTSSSILVYKSLGEGQTSDILVKTLNHGLTLDTFVSINGTIDDDIVLHINLMTLAGNYTADVSEVGRFEAYNEDFKGSFEVTPLNVTLSNVVATVGNSKLKCPLWIFGDSYFTLCENIRVGYQLKALGALKNVFLQAYGGETAQEASVRFFKALAYARPKCVIWAEGMNGNKTNWEMVYDNLKSVSKALNIKFVFCTVPVPQLQSADPTSKQQITDFVRANETEYIDSYKAVGSNSSGIWYGDGTANAYQNNDKVHTTVKGALAIAYRYLVDFPDIRNF